MRTPLNRVSRRGRVTIAVLAAVFLIFSLLDRVVDTWTDWLWFDQVGYTKVFSTTLQTRLALFAGFGLAMALLVAANLYLAFRLRPAMRLHSAEQHALERYRMLVAPHIRGWIAAISIAIGVFTGLAAQSQWQTWMLFINGGSFGVKDPQFGIDIGFYVFEYPFWRYLLGVGFTAVVICVLGSLAVHYLFGGVRLQGAGERMTTAARAHLSSLIAVFVLLKAVAYFLDRRGLLLAHSESADVYGAGYTDVHALLPAKDILTWISVVVAVAIVVFSNAVMRSLVWPGVALGLLIISAIAIGGVVPWSVQAFTVRPSPLAKETEYIERSIKATRDAFGLSNLDESAYNAAAGVPATTLINDTATVPNIRLLDPAVVADTYTAREKFRFFYDFTQKLDIDRYEVNGQTQDYVVGMREIDYTKLQQQSTNWQNRHTVYTHGHGFVAAPANQLTCGGLPYFVSGFFEDPNSAEAQQNGQRCVSQAELIVAKQPRIYYGENMTDYAIVGKPANGKDVEFDRPRGGSEDYFTYDGQGGIDISSYGRRILYATQYREANFLLSSVFNDNSKLLYVRDPRQRVEKVAPFLRLDGDPYPAVIGGKIVWILDGYTASATYPYSQRVDLKSAAEDALTGAGTFAQDREEINYLRNSVKATVDAYSGEVQLYTFDESDPVLKAWNKGFGGIVKPRSAIPQDLMDHFRYPEDQFKVQRELLTRYHITDPKTFFNKSNLWEVPNDPAREQAAKQPPYYVLAKFPGQEQATFQLSAAMMPKGGTNLAALVSAYYDSDGQPKMQVLQLPTTVVNGPVQVHQNMTNSDQVRQDLTLLESQNSQVVFGNLLSLPVGEGLLYVEPVYVRSKGESTYPILHKVLISYNDKVAYADTVGAALAQLAGQAPPAGTTPPATGNNGNTGSSATAAAVQRINDAVTHLQDAQKAGDFEAYGKALKELNDAVKAYQDAQKSEPAPTPAASTPASPAPSASASQPTG